MISQVLPYIIFQVKISASVVPIVSCIVRIFSRLFPCTFKILSRYLPGISRQKPWKDANKKRFVTAQGGVLASDHRHGDRIANGSLSLASFHPLLPSHHCLFYVWCGYFHGRVNCHKMLSFAWVLLPLLLCCLYCVLKNNLAYFHSWILKKLESGRLKQLTWRGRERR